MKSSQAQPGRPPRESRSTLYVLGSASLSALLIGLTLFLLVRGYQWRGALAALRAEPGIEILSVERSAFFKKRLLGLRDPLAPTVESILTKHNIGPHSVEIVLTEYHSLNTPYAEQRNAEAKADEEALRAAVLSAVGQFADSAVKKREADLEKITQMLFEARFPEAMKTVDINWKDGAWHVAGELYAPEHKNFVAEAPAYIVEGALDFGNLVDLTDTRTALLRDQIESPDLFAVDLDQTPVHLERMVRLVADYDAVCERSRLPKPQLRLELASTDPASARDRLTVIKGLLTGPGAISPDRFLPDASTSADEAEASASLKLVPFPAAP